MKQFARISDGAVAEIVATDKDIATLFHPGMTWVNVTGATVAVGDIDTGGKFTAPPAPPVPEMPTVAQLHAEIVRITQRLALLERHEG